ncbi:PTS system IIA component, Glc family [Seinonella peptonophila]|uniref:PTS system IIA component, Glc family n=1 Tax=Seinonella peptonophila TaxID=112248 RepID=A0A1M4Z9K3_9BACL|nr:PTS glucose transporter subunit IIA [Seinonella peptonophila]SHF14655.1 PTS system IIA component, Glc family [Seinonella peptonophila]
MFKKLFGRTNSNSKETLFAPLSGQIVPLDQVPDAAFAEKMLGDGVAIQPAEGEVVAPIEGEVVTIPPTKHAIGIRSPQGVEILIHIGLDTVQLKGEGFETLVEEGQRVSVGQPLLRFQLDLLQAKGLNTVTPVVITDTKGDRSVEVLAQDEVTKGKTILIQI